MTLAEPNMEDCNPKKKCLSGDNAGQAYTPGKECGTGYEFNAATCDCDSIIPSCGNNVDERGNCQGFFYVRFDYQYSSYQQYAYNWQWGQGYFQCDRYFTLNGQQYCDWDYYLPVSYKNAACDSGSCVETLLKVGSCNRPQNPLCSQQEPTIEVHGPNWSGGPGSDADWPATCDCDLNCGCISESISIQYKVSYRNYNGNCELQDTKLCTSYGGSPVTVNISGANMIHNSSYEFISNVVDDAFDCSPSYVGQLKYWGCENGVPVQKTQRLYLGPLCDRIGNYGQGVFELVDPEVIPGTPTGDCT